MVGQRVGPGRDGLPPIMLILIPADLEDRHDVGVVEPGDRLGLVLEAADLVGRGEPRGPDHLQGHRAIQAELPGLVDDPHAPFAQHSLATRSRRSSRCGCRVGGRHRSNRPRRRPACRRRPWATRRWRRDRPSVRQPPPVRAAGRTVATGDRRSGRQRLPDRPRTAPGRRRDSRPFARGQSAAHEGDCPQPRPMFPVGPGRPGAGPGSYRAPPRPRGAGIDHAGMARIRQVLATCDGSSVTSRYGPFGFDPRSCVPGVRSSSRRTGSGAAPDRPITG